MLGLGRQGDSSVIQSQLQLLQSSHHSTIHTKNKNKITSSDSALPSVSSIPPWKPVHPNSPQ